MTGNFEQLKATSTFESTLEKLECRADSLFLSPSEAEEARRTCAENVSTLLSSHGYPAWAWTGYRNLFDTSKYADNWDPCIPSDVAATLSKTDGYSDFIQVPDKHSKDIFLLCRYNGEPMVMAMIKSSNTPQLAAIRIVDPDGADKTETADIVFNKRPKYTYVQDQL